MPKLARKVNNVIKLIRTCFKALQASKCWRVFKKFYNFVCRWCGWFWRRSTARDSDGVLVNCELLLCQTMHVFHLSLMSCTERSATPIELTSAVIFAQISCFFLLVIELVSFDWITSRFSSTFSVILLISDTEKFILRFLSLFIDILAAILFHKFKKARDC